MSIRTVLKAAIPLGAAMVGLLTVAERLYLVNGAQYPRFLARDVGAGRFRRSGCTACCLVPWRAGGGLPEGRLLGPALRCGVFEGHTFISHADPFAQSTRRGA